MPALTEFVLRTALTQAAAWSELGHDLTIAANVSRANMLDPAFPAEVEDALTQAGVSPARLTLEIIEDTLLANPLRTNDVIASMRALGVSISIDHYGTGHSSLAYLKDLAADELKIDSTFTGALAQNQAAELIVTSTIGLAHGLGLRVVAEGVEDQHTWEWLALSGCDRIQGAHLMGPAPADALTEWLGARRATVALRS